MQLLHTTPKQLNQANDVSKYVRCSISAELWAISPSVVKKLSVHYINQPEKVANAKCELSIANALQVCNLRPLYVVAVVVPLGCFWPKCVLRMLTNCYILASGQSSDIASFSWVLNEPQVLKHE